jgi:hypothetical protein
MMNYWMFKRDMKKGWWVGDTWDFATEGLIDTIGEKREALFVKILGVYKAFDVTEVRVSQEVADVFFIDASTYYWPERNEYPFGEDGPRTLRFTNMNMVVCADCPRDTILFRKRSGYWETVKILNLWY